MSVLGEMIGDVIVIYVNEKCLYYCMIGGGLGGWG